MNHCFWYISFGCSYFLFPLDPENMLFVGGLGKKIGILTCIKSITICIEILELIGEWKIGYSP